LDALSDVEANKIVDPTAFEGERRAAMSITAPKKIVTPEDLLTMPDAGNFELVDGELVERNVSVLANKVEVLVVSRLQVCAEANNAGEVCSGTLGCRFYPNDPDKIRKPDATFVRRDRLSPDHYDDGFLTIRPDIVVEVISANDNAHEVIEKREEYLSAGVPLIWIIDPESRTVEVFRVDGTVSRLTAGDELLGEEVFPEFHCKVAELFPKVMA
jgi:Uma2 family endonuclease